MMASFMSYFGGQGDSKPRVTTKDAIVTLRQLLRMVEKKEEYLQKRIDEELKKAKQNVVSNKAGRYPPSMRLIFIAHNTLYLTA